MSTTIHVGNALDVLAVLPSESVHCCVTSPPYWGLRSYEGGAGMIGLEPTFDEHLANLASVFREVRRVLRDDGTLWLNYGDAYAGAGRTSGAGEIQDKHRARSVSSSLPPVDQSSFKSKDLMMMPARVAMALRDDGAVDVRAMRTIERIGYELADEYRAADEEIPAPVRRVLDRLAEEYAQAKGDSWWLRSEIIWHKPNPMPESCTDRPTSSHEKLFLLTKSARYFYDAEAVRVEYSNNTDVNRRGGGMSAALKGRDGVEFDRRNDFGRDGLTATGANIRNVWTIPTHSFKEAHFATFPPALVEPCIKAGTSERGVCGECGAPWKRQVQVQDENKRLGKAYNDHTQDLARGLHGVPPAGGAPTRTTTGWQATCACGADTVSAVVLDPFAGSGTVGLVADRLQRDSVLIELSPEYAEMAGRRIKADAPLLANVVAAGDTL